MQIRQLSIPRSATIVNNEGETLFTIELPSQPFVYDAKKNEGLWYQVNFVFVPGPTASDSSPRKGTAPIGEFCEIGCTVTELDRRSSRYLHDDVHLSVREPIKGFDNSTVTLFYREGQPWFHLKLLDVEIKEAAWKPDLLDPLRQLADDYQAEREAFEVKMKAKVKQVGTNDQ